MNLMLVHVQGNVVKEFCLRHILRIQEAHADDDQWLKHLVIIFVISFLAVFAFAEEYSFERFNYSSPAILGGQIFVGDYEGISAIREQDGHLIWKNKLGWVDSRPIIDGNRICVVSLKGEAFALSASNGKILWQHKLDEKVIKQPIIQNNSILLTGEYIVTALEARSGKLMWKNRFNIQISAPIILAGSKLFVKSQDGVRAFKYPQPVQLWHYNGVKGPGDLRLVGDKLLASDFNSVHCIDKTTGNSLWELQYHVHSVKGNANDFEHSHLGALAQFDRRIFVGVDRIYALDMKTGNILWFSDAPSDQRSLYPVANEIGLFWTNFPFIEMRSLDTGKLKWRYELKASRSAGMVTRPLLHGNKIYFTDGYSNLYAVSANNGKLIWVSTYYKYK